ncbi:helix-turn-helix domain-containing protein [Lacisediminihabitans sp. FW035]
MARASIPFTDTERVIAENIRQLREQRRMSQSDLAEAMSGGWTATTVSKIETINGANTRHLNADEMVRLAKILSVKLDDLTQPNVAGSSEFVSAMRAGEAFNEALFAAVTAANDAIQYSDEFLAAQDLVSKDELEALDPPLRSAYEELFTYFNGEMLGALSRVPKAMSDSAAG